MAHARCRSRQGPRAAETSGTGRASDGGRAVFDAPIIGSVRGGRESRGGDLNLESLREKLRCPTCGNRLVLVESGPTLECARCPETFPIEHGIPRMVTSAAREALAGAGGESAMDPRQVATARSFGFEWERFSEMYAEWETSFLEYVAPHGP